MIDPERAPTLRDPDRDARLRRDGFATLPLLDDATVSHLRAARRELSGPDDDGLVADYADADRARMAAVARLLAPVWEEHLDHVLIDHRVVFCSFVVKYPDRRSSMFLHEDRTFVDERRHRAGTLWIPLVDTSPELGNGCLQVVPGSHRLALTMSGTRTPELFRPYQRALERRMVPLALRAGEAAFYDARLLHGSPNNQSTEPREAIVCAVAPRDAELVHVVGVGHRRRRLHRVDDRFFLDHAPQSLDRAMPEGYPVLEEYDDDVTDLPPALLAEVVTHDVPPAPDVLVPPDLEAALRDGPSPPPSEFPERPGSLLVIDVPVLGARPGPGRVLGELPPRELWPPATLGAPVGPRWAVGDPRGLVVADDAAVVALHLRPGDRFCFQPSSPDGRAAVVEVHEAPPVGSGVVGQGAAAVFVPGTAVEVPSGRDQVVWNHGPGPLVLTVEVAAGDGSRPGVSGFVQRLRAERARRRWRREIAEAERALAPVRAEGDGGRV